MPKSLAREEQALEKILSRIEEETLDPAKEEAASIIAEAKRKAEEILRQAEKDKEAYLAQGHALLVKEKEAALSSMRQAASEGLEFLKQKIQNEFFEKSFSKIIEKKLQERGILDKIIETLLDTLKKEGLNSRFSVVLPKVISSKELAEISAKYALESLESDAKNGDLSGGVEIKLHDKHLLLDCSSKAISELLLSYIRKDLRELLFGKEERSRA